MRQLISINLFGVVIVALAMGQARAGGLEALRPIGNWSKGQNHETNT